MSIISCVVAAGLVGYYCVVAILEDGYWYYWECQPGGYNSFKYNCHKSEVRASKNHINYQAYQQRSQHFGMGGGGGGGGGGKTPKCTKKSRTCKLYRRASEASECLRNIFLSCPKIRVTSAYIYAINVVPFYYLLYGAVNSNILTLRKICV